MVSSKDVAKRAGVSQSTVSRVMNDPLKVSKIARESVLHAMEELNYRPNSVARSLVNKKTKSIALISGPLHNPFFVETTTSIVNSAKQHGYHTNVHFENFGDNMSLYKDVLSHQFDGLILSSIFYKDPIYEELKKLDVHFVMFNRKHQSGGHYVEIDNIAAGRLAAEHLLKLGHRDIAWIGGDLKTSTFHGRHKGYLDAVTEQGIQIPEHFIQVNDTTRVEVHRAIESMLARKQRPTAIFAATDSIAIFILDYLHEKGYSVPDDISLIGMDNIEWSSHHSFQLTTVGHDGPKNLGQLAIEHLMDLMNSEKKEEEINITVEPKVFVRKTTKEL
ncbi:LacI family DNA-binding transcriptional regulator [Pseudalkalibacillus decolorationis]|uniref:LacI family DNA-binding transcriptional regulator n=1 Tax=Pseudalkalibacillus decolorationis TaxID=163879 RepID=UPI0021491E8D|nr:LacI family DNA-binding transcriptional regulator [Pseudalkalibacillus decolorationis]